MEILPTSPAKQRARLRIFKNEKIMTASKGMRMNLSQ